MHYLPFLAEMPYLYLVQAAFMVWMLIDCNRRGADSTWFWVILLFPGFGAWAYFFVVKVRDFHGFERWNLWHFQSRPSLDELRYRVEQSPTQTNHLALAERLMEQGEHTAAMPHLEAVLAREPDYGLALYQLAVCHMATDHPDWAAPLAEKIIARDRRWSNYRAWHLLRDARTRIGDAAGAVAACEELVRLAPTLQHQCLLAEQLLDGGRLEEAHVVLDKGMEDYHFAPRASRWRDRRWASQARRLLKRIEVESG